MYVGPLDRDAADSVPPEFSKENMGTIGSGFLKVQPMAVSDAALFASSDDAA
jgi:hypothetical protein